MIGSCLRKSTRLGRPLIQNWNRKPGYRPPSPGVFYLKSIKAHYSLKISGDRFCSLPELASCLLHVLSDVYDQKLYSELSSSRLCYRAMHSFDEDIKDPSLLGLYDESFFAQWCLSPNDSPATPYDRSATESSNESRKRKREDDDDTSTDRSAFESGGGGDANSDDNSDNEGTSRGRSKKSKVNGKVLIACNFCRCAWSPLCF